MDKNADIEKKAVALNYNVNENNAPIVLTKGCGKFALHILEKAEENDVKIYKDEDLINILYELPEGIEIPEELYKAVAQIYVALYTTNKKFIKE